MSLLTALCWLVTGVAATLLCQLLHRALFAHGQRLEQHQKRLDVQGEHLALAGKELDSLRAKLAEHEQQLYALDKDVGDIARKTSVKRYQE